MCAVLATSNFNSIYNMPSQRALLFFPIMQLLFFSKKFSTDQLSTSKITERSRRTTFLNNICPPSDHMTYVFSQQYFALTNMADIVNKGYWSIIKLIDPMQKWRPLIILLYNRIQNSLTNLVLEIKIL